MEQRCLISAIKVAETLVTNFPKMRAEIDIYANCDDPNRCLRIQHMFTLDELKDLVYNLILNCAAWEFFEIK